MKRTLRWIWLVIISLALVMHLSGLNRTPLSPSETQLALPALDVVRGEAWPASTESPLLLVSNALLFYVFGPGDGIARLIPALLGCVLVILPFLWRRRLGNIGALMASALLLTSSLVLFASRQVDSTLPGALGAVLLLTVILGDMQDVSRATRVLIGSLGLTLGLTGGPGFYDVLLPGLVAWGVYRWIEPESDTSAVFDAGTGRRVFLVGVIAAVLLSAGLGWRWNGWLGIGDGLIAWFTQWRVGEGHIGPGFLLLYEPLIVLAAVLCIFRAVRRSEAFPLALLVWALLALLLITLRPGSSSTSLVATLVPLALLAGWGTQEQGETLLGMFEPKQADNKKHPRADPSPLGFKLGIGLHTVIVFVLWMHALLALARYTLATPKQGAELILILLTILIQAFLMFGMMTLFEPRVAWRGLILGSFFAVLVLQIGFTWSLGILHPADPAEVAVTSATSLDMWRLRRTIDDLMIKKGKRRDTLDIALVRSDPVLLDVLRWTLRDFPGVQVYDTWPSETFTGLIVTAEENASGFETNNVWQGMTAAAIARQLGPRVSCGAESWRFCPSAVKWYLYRQGNIPPQIERILLWSN